MNIRNTVKTILLPWLLVLLLCSGCSGVPADSDFEVDYIDVGQADAALVRCDGHTMLIDGGNADDSRLIYSFLKERNITDLDYVVCTHAHEDHVGGLAGALNQAQAGTAYAPVTAHDSRAFQSFVKYLNQQNVAITVPEAGTTFSLGAARVTILGPVTEAAEENNTSIVLRVVYGNTSFLFTGDAEAEEEQSILDSGAVVRSDVLKVGHHGSDASTGYRWLREVQPAYAVISVETGNPYGHPTENTLRKLRDADVTVYRTDLQGTIVARSDGTNITFSTERNAEADTLDTAGNGTPAQNGATPGGETGAGYVLNTKSKKFHRPDCSSVKKMGEQNKAWETGRDAIIEMGYTPCGSCNP